MSKIESGSMTINSEPLLLSDLLENVVAIIQPDIKTRNQHFFIRLHNITHEYVTGDPLRLRQIFINILSNSSKFTPHGGSISLDMKECPPDQPGQALFSFVFSDTGIGMTEEFINHIFDTFTRERVNSGAKAVEKIAALKQKGGLTMPSFWIGRCQCTTDFKPLR